MKKRLFETLDEMNLADIKDGTRLVQVSSNFIACNTVTGGAKIEMGIPRESAVELWSEETMPVLLLVNKKEYQRLISEPVKK